MANSEGTFGGNGSVNWAFKSQKAISGAASNNGNTLKHTKGQENDGKWDVSGIDETLPPALAGDVGVIQESADNTWSASPSAMPSFTVTIELPPDPAARSAFLEQLVNASGGAREAKVLKIRFYLPIVGKRTEQISVKWETLE